MVRSSTEASAAPCWAFTATGVVESQWALAGHAPVVLSDQQLTSCDTNQNGCEGGMMQIVFKWIIEQNEGYVASDSHYPYVNSESKTAMPCNAEGAGAAAKIDRFVNIPKSEKEIKSYVANVGPVGISVEAYNWQLYTGGIITSCNNLMITHAAIIVGYDASHTTPYWVVRNTWGDQWVSGGYIRLAMDNNVCLMTQNPTMAFCARCGRPSKLPHWGAASVQKQQ